MRWRLALALCATAATACAALIDIQDVTLWDGGAPDAVADAPSEAGPNDAASDAAAPLVCGGNVCKGGVAPPECTDAGRCVLTLASGQGQPWHVATDGVSVYWTDHDAGALWKAPIDGSRAPTMVVPAGNAADYLVYSSKYGKVYFTSAQGQGSGGGVYSVPGSATQTVSPTLVATDAYATGVDVDDTNQYVYWANLAGDVTRTPLPNGVNPAPPPLKTIAPTPEGIAVGGKFVYVANAAAGNIERVPLDGGAPSDLVTSVTSHFVFHMGSLVYYTDSAGGTVDVIDCCGGSPLTKLAASQSKPMGLFVAAQTHRVYWANQTGAPKGSIRTVAPDGGAWTELAPSPAPYDVCAWTTTTFWTDPAAGTVKSVTPND